jgi:hypothetical protein
MKPFLTDYIEFVRRPLCPKTSVVSTFESLHIEVYEVVGGPNDGTPYCRIFRGKATKPYAHYRFRDTEKRAAFILQEKAKEQARIDHKAKRKAERASFRHTLKVGDILYASWGYDQTNIDFYQVVAVREKSVLLREIGQDKTETGWLQGDCTPRKDDFVGEPVLKRVTEGNTVKFASYKYAWPVEGRSRFHWTAYA